MAACRKYFIPLESNPELFTEVIHKLGMSKRLVFHDLLTLSPSDKDLLSFVPRPVLALILVIPAPDGYAARIREEEKEVPLHDKAGDEEDVMFYHQTIGNACGLYAALHAVSNGEARSFIEPSTHIARLIERCTPLNSAQRIEALESDEELAAAHASVGARGNTAPPEDLTSRKSGRLYQLEGCRKAPLDLACVLGEDEDMLSAKALDAVKGFVEEAGKGVAVGYSALALSVTGGGEA
ncbi:ubiquitin C-terminal hydrolase L3 [Xylaria sp. FL0043]|nr:ubiquitin C-terminal hydrolase L3 [Xylaria sp. FL0043]